MDKTYTYKLYIPDGEGWLALPIAIPFVAGE